MFIIVESSRAVRVERGIKTISVLRFENIINRIPNFNTYVADIVFAIISSNGRKVERLFAT